MDQVSPLIQLGAIGVMLWLTWQALQKKDADHKVFVDETIKSLKELISETTKALADKNASDNKMADAIELLTDEIRKTKDEKQ